MTAAPRPYPLCGHPTPPAALLEAHLGPTKRNPRADVVVWLCLSCGLAVTDPGRRRRTVGGWRR